MNNSIIMSGAPPPYEAATGGLAPSINVTSAPSQPSSSTQHATGSHSHGAHHNEFEDDSSEDEMDNDGMLHPLQNDVEGRKSMDDEYRELPEGWVRCFDKKWVSSACVYEWLLTCLTAPSITFM